MSKSILVIDTPENCYDCGIRKGYSCGGISSVCGIGKTLPTNLHKPDWCPLKELPKTSVGIEVCIGNKAECVKSYVDGYNACIDEILKGENDND